MKVLAFLQNQWFPAGQVEGVKRVFAAYPGRRNELIARFLFFRCRTGQVLRQVFSDGWCDRIIWENASPQIADRPSGCFGYDVDHIRSAIDKHMPDIVLAFGRVASNGVLQVEAMGYNRLKVINGPHPAVRGRAIGTQLEHMRLELECYSRKEWPARGRVGRA